MKAPKSVAEVTAGLRWEETGGALRAVRTDALQTAAAALIAGKRTKSVAPTLTEHAIEQLRDLVEYNDGVRGSSNRVSWRAACSMLRDHFGWPGGADALNAVCREQLGRKSWSQK